MHDLAARAIEFERNVEQSFVDELRVTTPPGTGGYMNPHLYPVMLLQE